MVNIVLNGESFRIGFDFSTLLAIEDEFGKNFSDVLAEKNRSNKDNLRFLYAVVKAFNPGVPDFGEWLHCLTHVQDIDTLNTAVLGAQAEFFCKPAGLAKEENEDGSSPNA